jgi:hypothetical protein
MTLSKLETYLLIFAFVLSVISGTLIYITNKPQLPITQKVGVSEMQKDIEDVVAPRAQNSTMEYYTGRINQFDQALTQSNLTPQEQIELLLRKGYYLSNIRSASSIENSLRDSINSFEEAQKILTEHNELSAQYSVPVKFGILYNFAVNCFPTLLIRALPLKHIDYARTLFSVIPTYDTTSSTTILIHQKAAFIAMLDYAYNDPDLSQSNDKSVISHRMLIASIYLASFADALTKDEKDELLKKIQNDLDRYEMSIFTIFSNKGIPYHIAGELQSLFHYALSYDVVYSYNDSLIADEINKSIDANYARFNTALKNSPSKDVIALAMLGAVANGYYLSSLERRYGTDAVAETLYAHTIDNLKAYAFTSPETADVIKGSFNYTLTTQGQWGKEKARIFTVANSKPELESIFSSLGVAL